MNNLIAPSLVMLFGALSVFLVRKSLSSLLIGSVSLFVVGLPWVRLMFSGGELVSQNSGMTYAYAMFAFFILGALAVAMKLKGYGSFSGNSIEWIRFENNGDLLIKYSVAVLSVAWGLRIYRATVYGILFSGSGNEDAIAGVDYLFVVVYSLVTMLSMGAYFCLCALRSRLGYGLLAFLVLEIIWALMSSGRRDFIFYSGVFLFFYLIVDKKMSYKSIIFVALFLYIFVGIVTPLFIQARINILNYMTSRGAVESVYYGLGDAVYDVYSSGGSAKQVVSDNLAERGDAAEFAGKIYVFQGDSDKHSYGDALFNSFSWAVPSFIVAKPVLMVEQYIQDFYGMPIMDDAVSWVSVGYADFSYFGCFLYGALLIALLYVIVGAGFYSGDMFTYITASIQACYVAYSVEADPLLAFSSIRDIFIVFIVVYMFKCFRPFFKN